MSDIVRMNPARIVTVVLLAWLAAAVVAAAGEGDQAMDSALAITSPAFADGQPIPAKYTADGANISPELTIAGPPAGTACFALIVDDPDAPMGTWVHWVVWNIPSSTTRIPEARLPAGSAEGRNSWGRTGYGGPSPPSGTHHYHFKLYALDRPLELPRTADKQTLIDAMEGRVLARAQLTGTYRR
jgi:Raf kinase inhibitor-like YbhB/YbcL family protein